MRTPAVPQAEALLAEAERLNPGPWVAHSQTAARVARAIAARCGMDADAAYVMGLLHDIGRREGFFHLRHTLDGYRYLMGLGYGDAADICITHSFPLPDPYAYHGVVDCPPEDHAFVCRFIAERRFTDYDRLIQLCDALSLPEGPVLLEKRLVDVVMRHGLHEFTLRKWEAFFALKRFFDERVGGEVYRLFPDVAENTFGFRP